MADDELDDFTREALRRLSAAEGVPEHLARRYDPPEKHMNAPKFIMDISLGSLLTIGGAIVTVTASHVLQEASIGQIRRDAAEQQEQLHRVTETVNSRSVNGTRITELEKQVLVLQAIAERNIQRLNDLSVLEVKITAQFQRYEEILSEQRAESAKIVTVLEAVREELRKRPAGGGSGNLNPTSLERRAGQ